MKSVLLLLISVLLFSSCSPCKRLQRKCPPEVIRERYDSIITKDTIIYRDKLIEIPIPGDTVYAEKKVPVKEDISPIWLQNDYASATAWVSDSKLKLELIQKEQVIRAIIDSAEKEVRHWKEKYTTDKLVEIVKEKYIPGIYKSALKFSIFVIASVLLFAGWKVYKLVK